jgi:hypothetical protein
LYDLAVDCDTEDQANSCREFLALFFRSSKESTSPRCPKGPSHGKGESKSWLGEGETWGIESEAGGAAWLTAGSKVISWGGERISFGVGVECGRIIFFQTETDLVGVEVNWDHLALQDGVELDKLVKGVKFCGKTDGNNWWPPEVGGDENNTPLVGVRVEVEGESVHKVDKPGGGWTKHPGAVLGAEGANICPWVEGAISHKARLVWVTNKDWLDKIGSLVWNMFNFKHKN